jgi:ubiquinone/menaquinone biosynthesis C-methylase UbiE
MLAIARSGLPPGAQQRASFQAASIEALPFADASFDVVCSAGVIEYLRSYETALGEFHRVLKPGGLLLLPTTNLLAFGHWLRPIQEPLARIPAVAGLFGVRPSTFRLRYHYVPKFKRSLRAAGFVIEQERYFYLTLPRPLDRVFPSATHAVETFFDRRMGSWVRHLAEGYLAAARKGAHRSRTDAD